MPIMFMISTVGVSPKKFEIGGVAPPNESPPVTRKTPSAGVGLVRSNQVVEEGGSADGERRVRAPALETLSAASASGANWRVPVADVEDRDLLQLPRAEDSS